MGNSLRVINNQRILHLGFTDKLKNITLVEDVFNGKEELVTVIRTDGVSLINGYELAIVGVDIDLASILLETQIFHELMNIKKRKRSLDLPPIEGLEYTVEPMDKLEDDIALLNTSTRKMNPESGLHLVGGTKKKLSISERFHSLFKNTKPFNFKGYKLITLRGHTKQLREEICPLLKS